MCLGFVCCSRRLYQIFINRHEGLRAPQAACPEMSVLSFQPAPGCRHSPSLGRFQGEGVPGALLLADEVRAGHHPRTARPRRGLGACDVFVQFLAKDTGVAPVIDIRRYLSGILRNLYLLHLRRATRHPVQSRCYWENCDRSR